MSYCNTMADHNPNLEEGVNCTLSNSENTAAQLNLINASEQFLQVCDLPYYHAHIVNKLTSQIFLGLKIAVIFRLNVKQQSGNMCYTVWLPFAPCIVIVICYVI